MLKIEQFFRKLNKSICVFLIYILLPSLLVASLYFSEIKFEQNFYLNNFVNILIYVITAGVLSMLFYKVLKEQFKDFLKNWKSYIKKGFKWWLLGLLIMMVGNFIISFILYKGSMPANESANRILLKELPIFAIISMTIIIPYIEELVYRMNFRTLFKQMIPYAIFCGLFFGGMHVFASFQTLKSFQENIEQLLYIIPYAGLGFSFACAYFETDNIFTSIMLHIFHNTLIISTLFIGGL